MRFSLLSLKQTEISVEQTQLRLSTGLKVNSALDNPRNYYAANSLMNRAHDLNSLLDSMSQGIQTIKTSLQGLQTGEKLLKQASAVVAQACDVAPVILDKEWFENQKGVIAVVTSADELKSRIASSGIVGMGGATFPCHVKLTPPKGQKAECVIINAVECEPYLTADHRLMLEKADEILVGTSLIMKAVDVHKGYIGIENNKPDAIRLMTEKAKAYPFIEIVPLQVKYPQGGEKQLIAAITGREVPAPPALPINVGAVVQNVGTTYAIYEAVMKNKPLFERVITVTGKSLKQPSNFLARIGTPMKQLIEECGGLPEDTGKVIGGGPMMGKALMNLDLPVCKGSSGLLVMPEKESRRRAIQPCIRCAKCVSACPMGLEPYLLATASAMRNWELVEENDITSCIECGSCQFTCPSNRPMLDNIRLGKTTVMALIRARNIKK